MRFKSSFSRLTKIGQITAQMVGRGVAGTLASQSKLKTRVEQAIILTEGLSQLKGASMKLGQMLSIQGQDLLPTEVTKILSQLQRSAEPIEISEIRSLLVSSLGVRVNRISELSESALAAASVGQVHYGRLITGEVVAIKVQYPGVAEAIDSEIRILKGIVKPFLRIYGGDFQFDEVFDELRFVLTQEVDYLVEAGFQKEFKRLIGRDSPFEVPTPIDDLSTSNVLTMTFMDGITLDQLLAQTPSQALRNQIGLKALTLINREIFEWRLVQTDPNFANFLFQIESQSLKKLVLLDFGACKRFSEDFVAKYRQFGRKMIENDVKGMLEIGVDLQFISPKESKHTQELFVKMCLLSFRPILQGGVFDFDQTSFLKGLAQASFEFVRTLRHTAPPKDLIFLNRKLGGMYQLMRSLGVKLNVSDEVRPWLMETP
ncbi:MAG: AarF/ABC1/UbiB kinase family protein [Oligoflexia bacterium]|nr:AarF/ABC1/UbiB kinase family protein [Oligoflexia bacterium]